MVSASILQEQKGFNVTLKPCLNLWSRRWRKTNFSFVNIFIPNGTLILKIFISTGIINFINALQKKLWLLERRMFGSTLFHSLLTCRKKEFLKYSVLLGNTWKVLGCLWEFHICGSKIWMCDGCPVERNL